MSSPVMPKCRGPSGGETRLLGPTHDGIQEWPSVGTKPGEGPPHWLQSELQGAEGRLQPVLTVSPALWGWVAYLVPSGQAAVTTT